MKIYFSRYIFFLWFLFQREAKVLSNKEDRIDIQTKIKKLILKKSKQIFRQYLIIKYIPILFILILSITFNELKNLDIIIFLAPLFILLNFIFFNFRRILIPLSILATISIFMFYNILLFPLFIKYLIISYLFVELYLDIYGRMIFHVYEEEQKKPVAFAIIKNKE